MKYFSLVGKKSFICTEMKYSITNSPATKLLFFMIATVSLKILFELTLFYFIPVTVPPADHRKVEKRMNFKVEKNI